MMKRFFASIALLLAVVVGGEFSFAQVPSRLLFLEGQQGGSCPPSVKIAGAPCPKVDVNLATGTAWVQGQGYVPLSSLLSITNASGGYVTNWDGSMTWKFGPVTNLLTQSNNPNGWSVPQSGASASQNLTDPNGVPNNAWTITQTGANTSDSRYQNNVTVTNDGLTRIWSCYVQKNASPAVYPRCGAQYSGGTPVNGGIIVNPSTGAVLNDGGSAVNIGSVDAGNGWWRAWFSLTNNSSGNNVFIYMFYPAWNASFTATKSTVNGGSNGFAFGQMETISYATQTIPSSYVQTGGAQATSAAQLRLGLGTGLLVEESRVNMLVHSQDSSGWTPTSATLTDNSRVARDGSNTMILFNEGAATAAHYAVSTSATFVNTSTYACAVDVSVGTSRYIAFRGPAAAGTLWPWVTLDTQTDTLNANASVLTSGFLKYNLNGNVYYRIYLTVTTQAIATGCLVGTSNTGTAPLNSSSTPPSYAGANATFYFWGAQAELGAFPTSYYPTTTAAGTRSNDYVPATGTLLSLLTNANQGSLLAQTNNTNPVAGNPRIVGSGGTVTLLANNTTTTLTSFNGTTAVNATLGTGSTSVGSRAAVTWSGSTVSVGGNGGTVATNAAVSFSGLLSNAVIGCAANSASSSVALCINGSLTRLTAWGSALPSALIPTLTTPQPVLVTDFANGIYTWNGYNIGAAGLSSLFSVSNSGGYCTTSAGLLVSFSANTLRICNGTGLLPEDTRTNIMTQSGLASGWAAFHGATGTATLTTNFGVAPDGTTTAARAQISANSDFAGIQNTGAGTFGSTGTYSGSVYLRSNTGSNYSVSIFNDQCTNTTVTVTPVWQRLSQITSCTSGLQNKFQIIAGGNNQDILVWGAQVELGAFPSSYIATTTGTVTRNFDNIQALGPVLNLLGTQGANSMVAAWTQSQYYSAQAAPIRQYAFGQTDSGNARFVMWATAGSASGGPFLVVGDGTAVSTVPGTNQLNSAGAPVRSAIRWSNTSADAAMSTNGGATATASRQYTGTLSPFFIGNLGAGSAGGLNSPLGYMAFYPGGLSNAQLPLQ